MANKEIVTREVTYAGRACALKAYVAEPAGVELFAANLTG